MRNSGTAEPLGAYAPEMFDSLSEFLLREASWERHRPAIDAVGATVCAHGFEDVRAVNLSCPRARRC